MTHYSALNFKSKQDAYWEKRPDSANFRTHYAQWLALLNIRTLPDDTVVIPVQNVLMGDYGHLNENSVTDAIKMNLRGEFTPMIEAYQLLNENFIIKLLTAYNKRLLEAHRIAVALRNKATEKPEPTPEETEAKNIKAMKEVFSEYKQTGNETLISGLYYDFFNDLGLIKFTKEQKLEFMERAKVKLREVKVVGEGLLAADKILKEIEKGGYKDEVISMAKRITVIEFFNSIEKLEL